MPAAKISQNHRSRANRTAFQSARADYNAAIAAGNLDAAREARGRIEALRAKKCVLGKLRAKKLRAGKVVHWQVAC